MELGFAAWGLRETPLPLQFEFCAKRGLALELGIANATGDVPVPADNKTLDEILKLSEAYGVKILGGATGNDFTLRDCNALEENLTKVKGAIDVCAYLHIPYLRIFAGFSPVETVDDHIFQEMIRLLDEANAYAEEKSIRLCLETHGGVDAYKDGVKHFHSVTTNIETLLRIEKSLKRPIGINLDVANLYAVGVTDLPAFIEKIKAYVVYYHFKDFAKTKSGALRPCACGEGFGDLPSLLTHLNLESAPIFFEYENTQDVFNGLDRCLAYFKKIVSK